MVKMSAYFDSHIGAFLARHAHADHVTTAYDRLEDVVVTSDQISAFPTKKSTVYTVRFTRQNLLVAGGAFLG